MLFRAQKTDPLQVRQLGAAQVAAPLGAQLGHDLVECGDIVMVAQVVDEEDVFAFGLAQQVAQLVFAVIGVHREQNGPDLGRGELQGHPVGHVGGPDRHFFALLHAQRHEPLGELVHHVGEFPPGQAVVAVGVDNGLPVGKAGHGMIENLPQGPFAQFKLSLPLAYFFVHTFSPRPPLGSPRRNCRVNPAQGPLKDYTPRP